MTELLTLRWLTEASVFELRQRGREVSAALGCDSQDQIRLAVALSEVGREVLTQRPASVVFEVLDHPARLAVTLTAPVSAGDTDPAATGFAAARRLVDDVTVDATADAVTIVLVKGLPPGAAHQRSALPRLRRALAAAQVHSPVEELRTQNAELAGTLDQLTQRQHDLLCLNDELEETNRGVLAMYTQLSGELEETNRGVVALYAELDEKGRQLVEANEAKTRFLRSVSHELRAPVNSILGLTELLGGSALDDEQRRQVDYLQTSARSLLELVNELLDLGRAESGRLEVALAPVEFGPLFAELRGTLRPVALGRGIDLVVDAPHVPALRSDRELLARVLRNLLTNAVAFTERGQVRMTAIRRSGEHVDIEVSDSGIGIPAEYHARVFEEFFQVPGPLQSRRKGTGLGLPYARHVTEALGGTLALRSEPGHGSTFTVTLPITGSDAAEASDEEVGAVRLAHILVVDDDEAFRHLVRGMLQRVAAKVSEASDGSEALAAVRRLDPDLMLLDLRMPNVDGATVLAQLRSDPDRQLRDLPVVLMTSADIDAEVRRAAAPAAALLAKNQIARPQLIRLLAGLLAGGAVDTRRGGT